MKNWHSLLHFPLSLLVVITIALAGCGGGGGGGATTAAPASSAASTTDTAAAPAPSPGTSVISAPKPRTSPTPSPTPAPMPTGTTSPSPSPSGTTSPSPSPSGTTSPTVSSNPFSGATFFVDPQSAAAKQVAAWSTTQPSDAAQVQKIASQPVAKWLSGGTTAIPQGDVDWMNARWQAGQTPFLVLYSIPQRDTGGLAAGGQTTSTAYQSWIDSIATAIGTHRAIVVLEPDALAQMGNLSAAEQQIRYNLFNYAVSKLKALSSVTVYLDAGNPYWVTAANMAPRLQQAGVATADGFSLNVSNFAWTRDCITYGDGLSSLVGGKHFVVDTSRNGLGPTSDYAWCNPPGRALGPQPLSASNDSLCDAYFWIKTPGFSDGACNGGPSWGWWADYALGLAQRAAY